MTERDDMMNRARAFKAMTETARTPQTQKKLEMAAFLELFHAGLSAEQKRELISEAGQ